MDLSILSDREGFGLHVMEALARVPLDYLPQLEFIDEQRKSQRIWAGGGILLPLYFREDQNQEENTPGHYTILLSKRSKKVQQPGDLFAPGGGIHPFMDSLLGRLLRFEFLPGIGGPGFALAKRRGNSIRHQSIIRVVLHICAFATNRVVPIKMTIHPTRRTSILITSQRTTERLYEN